MVKELEVLISEKIYGEVNDFLQRELSALKLEKKDITMTMLYIEEILLHLIGDCKASGNAKIIINKHITGVTVEVITNGQKLDLNELNVESIEIGKNENDEISKKYINYLILKNYREKFRTSYRFGQNTISVQVKKSVMASVLPLLIAIVLGLIVGFLVKELGNEAMCDWVNGKILQPITQLFLNAFGMIVAPIVFFSIVTSVSNYSDIKTVGRYGIKVMGFYLFTTFLAIAVAIGTFMLIKEWIPFGGLIGTVPMEVAEVEKASTGSFIETLIPSSFVGMFVENNMLSILFVAVLVGIALLLIGNKSSHVVIAFNELNEVFLKIVEMLVHVLPIFIFSSVASIVLSVPANLGSNFAIHMISSVVTMFVLQILYLVILFMGTGLNPVCFVRKVASHWVTTFCLSSSNAAMPYTMNTCEKLGCSSKIYSFSIPLGATINMDGSTVFMVLSTLIYMRLFGINMNLHDWVYIVISIVLISMALPGVPGTSLIGINSLLAGAGVPAAAFAFVACVSTIIDPFRTANNVVGDITGTIFVAHKEKLLDVEKYKS